MIDRCQIDEPAGTDSVRAMPIRTIRAMPSADVLHVASSRSSHLVSPLEAEVLKACPTFTDPRRLMKHVADKTGAAEPAVEDALRRCVEIGLLVSRARLLRELASAPVERSDAEIQWVAFPTRGSSAQLVDAVRSYVVNAAHRERLPNVLISTDSADAQPVRASLEPLRARMGFALSCVSRTDREMMARRLTVDAGVPASVARFGLLWRRFRWRAHRRESQCDHAAHARLTCVQRR